MDNIDPQKLAQMLQQQQAMKFMQSMQGTQGAGTMGEAERMQMQPNYEAMPQQAAMPAQGGMPVVQPQGDYGMPMPQQNYSANMPTNPQMGRREMLQGAVNSLGQQAAGQGMGQGAMTAQDAAMMRRMPR